MDTLDKLEEKLLDLSKRNKLINFKENKSNTLKIINYNVDEIFSNLINGHKLEIIDIKKISNNRNKQMVVSKPFNEIITIIYKINELYLKKNHLTYSQNLIDKNTKYTQLIANSKGLEINIVLKNIKKKAKQTINETGINVLYIAFGFVNWKEAKYSNIYYKAPLILIPITIENLSAIDPYYIHGYEDEIILNPVFKFLLSENYNVNLPEYSTDISILKYIKIIEKKLANLKWTISIDIQIGMFSFSKINMYLDLKNNEDKILNNPIFQKLIGKSEENEYCENEKLDTFKKNNILYHNVVDADSSQLEAIQLAKANKSFVLQGPPGTGKSQTITNIIAECLADGKKILFVSEKLAALNVVYRNLKKVKLEDFCLELHSFKSNKKQVIAELNRTLEKGKEIISDNARIEFEEYTKYKEYIGLL